VLPQLTITHVLGALAAATKVLRPYQLLCRLLIDQVVLLHFTFVFCWAHEHCPIVGVVSGCTWIASLFLCVTGLASVCEPAKHHLVTAVIDCSHTTSTQCGPLIPLRVGLTFSFDLCASCYALRTVTSVACSRLVQGNNDLA
jgi:hypothetical protein